MSINRILVLIIAAIIALIAAWYVNSITGNESIAPANIVTEVPILEIETTKVLVTTRGLKPGSKLQADDVDWKDWPSELVSDRFVTEDVGPDLLEDITGASIRLEFVTGEPIILDKIALGQTGGFMAMILDPSKRAASVQISASSAVAGFIQPGDFVDIISTMRSEADSQFKSITILQNIKVLAIDARIIPLDELSDGGRASTATLELRPDQVEVLALASQTGTISLSLRSLAVDHISDTDMMHINSGRNEIQKTVLLYRYGRSSKVVHTESIDNISRPNTFQADSNRARPPSISQPLSLTSRIRTDNQKSDRHFSGLRGGVNYLEEVENP